MHGHTSLDRFSCTRRFMKPVGWSGTDKEAGNTSTGEKAAEGALSPYLPPEAEMLVRAESTVHRKVRLPLGKPRLRRGCDGCDGGLDVCVVEAATMEAVA
eukprot:5432206-Pleurochrysis_carterae.AAC.2